MPLGSCVEVEKLRMIGRLKVINLKVSRSVLSLWSKSLRHWNRLVMIKEENSKHHEMRVTAMWFSTTGDTHWCCLNSCIVACLKQEQVATDPKIRGFLDIPVGAWKATGFLAGWKALGVLLQEKFICRNCTGSLSDGMDVTWCYCIWGTSVAKDCHEWVHAAKSRHQGDAGPISLEDDHENADNPKCAKSSLHRRNSIS